MHDEVSETENIRNNLAIERIIVGGCDILLDVNQVFIRKGCVIQVLNSDRSKTNRVARMGSFRGIDKEILRQCYLFSNHMLVCTRTSGGKLSLVDVSEWYGLISNLSEPGNHLVFFFPISLDTDHRKNSISWSYLDRGSNRAISIHCRWYRWVKLNSK